MILILIPKLGKNCEIPVTIAEIDIKTVTPESSREALEKWLRSAPKIVNQWTPYTLKIVG